MRFIDVPRNRTTVLGVLIVAASVLSLAIASPATAATDENDRAVGTPISATAQASYESQLSSFLSANPQPAAVDSSARVADQNAYWKAMATWWKSVPWEVVAGQWGCTSGTQSVTVNPVDKNGVVSAGQGGVMHCGTALGTGDLSRVALPEVRSVLEGEMGTLGTYCDFIGGTEDFCIRTSGTTMTASFQWFGSGTKTGKARLGLVGAGKPCAQGSQLALGALGTGQYGAVWYASGMVNYNSYFSSSWLYTGGSLYGRWCALI